MVGERGGDKRGCVSGAGTEDINFCFTNLIITGNVNKLGKLYMLKIKYRVIKSSSIMLERLPLCLTNNQSVRFIRQQICRLGMESIHNFRCPAEHCCGILEFNWIRGLGDQFQLRLSIQPGTHHDCGRKPICNDKQCQIPIPPPL